MPEGRLLVRGRALEVRWWGPSASASPACVLLHEGLGSVTTWRDFPASLADRTSGRVMAYSRLGHGASDLAARPRTPRFMHEEAIDELPAILDAAGLQAPYLVGHSDGASIAIIFAATYPKRTSGLVLEAPHVFVEDVSIRSIEQMATSEARPTEPKRGLCCRSTAGSQSTHGHTPAPCRPA